MSSEIYDLNCPFCGKVYKLPREKVVKHVGKTIFCRGCSQPFSVPPLPAFEPADVIEAGMFAAESVAENIASIDERPTAPTHDQASSPALAVAESSPLPPPFSAEVLPSINDVLPTVSDPPAIDLPHVDSISSHNGSDMSMEDDDDLTVVYRKGREHGALAVEEAPHDLDSNGSAYGSTADLPLPMPSPPLQGEPLDVNGIPSPGEPVQPPPKRPRSTASPVAPQLPQGIDLDSVPIARAAPPPPAPVINIDLKPVKRRLAWLLVLAVIILLLLIANILATLGYVPHRPI